MSETLTIKKFGPIKDVTLELRVVNILIGDQGTGKSTVAKLLSVIKETIVFPEKNLYVNGQPASEKEIMNEFLTEFKNQLEIYSIINYLTPDSYIEFSDSFAYFKYENQKIEVKEIKQEGKNKHTNVIRYIPAFREAAILLKNSLFGLAALKAPLPQYFYFFGQNLSNAKSAKTLYNYTEILDIKYKYVNDKDIIIMKNGQEITIEEASSAINSGIPLLLVFDNAIESIYATDSRIYHYANCPYIIVEEPEQNCFPTTQKKMMEHFILKVKYEISNVIDYYCRLFITTHSPYILTSTNNMMYAYRVGKEHEKEAKAIIDKKYWINPDDVSVYMMLTNGECEDIFDREEGLIKAEKIDGVTNILNNQFSELLNLEFSAHEFNPE